MCNRFSVEFSPVTTAEQYAQNREYYREYYRQNRERILQQRREREPDDATRERNRERQREWKARNPERVLELRREYRERHRDELRERNREYRAQNPERDREYYIKNRAQMRAKQNARYAQNPGLKGDEDRRSRHGLTPEAWAAMWSAQDNCCYLCGGELGVGKSVHIDHDHRCCPQGRSCQFCRRGLACNNCNVAIALVGDDPARLRRMADALERAQAQVTEHLGRT